MWHIIIDWEYMSSSLNSLKGVYRGVYRGTTIGAIKGDTRSLDYGSYNTEGGGWGRGGFNATGRR